MSEPTSISTQEREQGTRFAPKFDEAGLITAVIVDAATRELLVVAYMNAEALARTRETGMVTFWSRSRGELWVKGATSGNFLEVAEIRVDCDQDALMIRAHPAGPICHTGEMSCFYRRLDTGAPDDTALVKVKT